MLMHKRAKVNADGEYAVVVNGNGHAAIVKEKSSNSVHHHHHHEAPLHLQLCKGKKGHDPLNWGKVAAGLSGSHLEEVKKMVETFYKCREVVLEGASLTVACVAAIARKPEVKVVLNADVAKGRVDESSNWVLANAMKGTDTYGVTTGNFHPNESHARMYGLGRCYRMS